MKLIKKLISNLKSKKYSTTKLRERYVLSDDKYLKKAIIESPNYLRIQAVEYLSNFKKQENLDFLLTQFKHRNNNKLKAYIFKSILIISENEKLRISKSDENMLNKSFGLLKEIGTVNQNKTNSKRSESINFRSKLKDHLIELEDKKKINDVGF